MKALIAAMFLSEIRRCLMYAVILSISYISGCTMQTQENGKVGQDERLMEVALNSLEQKKIFFGHQSVGANILEGLQQVGDSGTKIPLRIVKMEGPRLPANPALAHAPIGKNMFPITKIEDFSKVVRENVGQWADLALFKFCYVDVTSKTDVKVLFEQYRIAMASLKEEYPDTVFLHVTVPLFRRWNSWKDVVKRVLGRKLGSDDDNIKRNEYNRLLLKEYEGKEPIFDLALAESTHDDGSRDFFVYNGKEYYTLASEYTGDGAHLNELGKRHVAEQFIIALAQAARKN